MSELPRRPDGTIDVAALLRESAHLVSRDLRDVEPYVASDELPLPQAPAEYDALVDAAAAARGEDAYPELTRTPLDANEARRVWVALMLHPRLTSQRRCCAARKCTRALDPIWVEQFKRRGLWTNT